MLLQLASCSSSPPSRYTMNKDAYPDRKLNASEIQDAVPQKVVRGKAGNKSPYTVLGETYHIIDDPKGFTQSGYASWYGLKFQGHLTSNGETYNMYEMTAAHKTLPIPTYVRVTNLDNNLSTVVRVNDRGPFHEGRIIDLSYAAATKLDYSDKGTARVKIEVLEAGEEYTVLEANKTPLPVVAAPKVQAVKSPVKLAAADDNQNYHLPANTYLQVAAYSSHQSANNAIQAIAALTDLPVIIREKNSLFKVQIGPIVDNFDLLQLRELIIAKQLGNPVVVYD
jgi:rare lipoprotein A